MPIVELILQATKSSTGTCILTLLLGICFVNGCTASVTSASRLLFAMARDKGIIFPQYFTHIEFGLNVPLRAIVLCFVFNVMFGLLYLGPSVAFNAYMSSCTIFLNMSYIIPIITLLVRGRGLLNQHRESDTTFNLGAWGYSMNCLAVVFVVVTSIVSFPNMIFWLFN